MKTLNFLNGDLNKFETVEGIEALKLRLEAYLSFIENDYFLDKNGFAYIVEYKDATAQKQKIINGCLKKFRSELISLVDEESNFENGRLDLTLRFRTIYKEGDIIVRNQQG